MLRPAAMLLRWPLASVSPPMAGSIGAAPVTPGSTANAPPAAPANTSCDPPGPGTNSCACRLPPPATDTRAAAVPPLAPARVICGACRSMRLSGAALRTSSGRCSTQLAPPPVVLPQGRVAPMPATDVSLPGASTRLSVACRASCPCGARSTPACSSVPARRVSAPPADSGRAGRPSAASGRVTRSVAGPASRVRRLSVVG